MNDEGSVSGKPTNSGTIAQNFISPWVHLRSAGDHPFLFERMISRADPQARAGNIVHVYDKSGRAFGSALYNPRSQITLRMLCFDETPIDEAFWQARLGAAVALRRMLNLDATTDAYRLVHAEGDGLSGLIVERYADVLVFEIFALGMFQRAVELGKILGSLLGPPNSLDRPQKTFDVWRTLIRADEHVESLEGFRVPPPRENSATSVVVREHGVRYRVDPTRGHKTGFFCDQRDNRRRLAGFCRDMSVLDLCCYSGGFGLCAKILGQAREVTSVDLDEEAVALARENANLNQARIDTVHADVFIYLRQMMTNNRQFDVVVLDPPKLARSRQEYDEAIRKYIDMNELAIRVVRPGGMLLTCSCSGLVSTTDFVYALQLAARRCNRSLQMLELTGAGPDHPIMVNCPESGYLKAAWCRVLKK